MVVVVVVVAERAVARRVESCGQHHMAGAGVRQRVHRRCTQDGLFTSAQGRKAAGCACAMKVVSCARRVALGSECCYVVSGGGQEPWLTDGVGPEGIAGGQGRRRRRGTRVRVS